MKLLTRWLDELPDSAGTFDMENLVSREYAQYQGPVDSPVSHYNHYDKNVVTQLTLLSVCDYGGERVAETPPNVHDERSCVT